MREWAVSCGGGRAPSRCQDGRRSSDDEPISTFRGSLPRLLRLGRCCGVSSRPSLRPECSAPFASWKACTPTVCFGFRPFRRPFRSASVSGGGSSAFALLKYTMAALAFTAPPAAIAPFPAAVSVAIVWSRESLSARIALTPSAGETAG